LRRLRRSLAKLDPDGALADAAARRRFHEAYAAAYATALEQPCAS
jgi:hypothetical protein